MKKEKGFNKGVIKIIFFSILTALFIFHFFRASIFMTASEMDLLYSRSVNSWGETWRRCYIYDDTLYYMNDTNSLAGTKTIKYSINGLVHNLSKLSYPNERFLMIDRETAVVREEGIIYLLHTTQDSRVELCSGNIIGFRNERLYYTDNTTLFEMDITQKVGHPIIVFDTLLASYYDGIIYEREGKTYSLLLETPLTPQLLTAEKIEWDGGGDWFEEYLFSDKRIIRISSEVIDVYSFDTGKIERIFDPELDSGILQMAATIHEDILYVSIQRTDIKNWTIKDKDTNGIYRYNFNTREWTKVYSKTYGTIMQFDEKTLYGVNEYRLMNLGDIERIPLD